MRENLEPQPSQETEQKYRITIQIVPTRSTQPEQGRFRTPAPKPIAQANA